MPKAAQIQTNFTAGELSPRLEGRVDIAKYFNGVIKLENMLIHPHGGATRRGGTKHISNGKVGEDKIRLVPFQFSVEQAYVLEFGENYIRFFRDQMPIGGGGFSSDFSSDFATPATLIEISSPYLESELFEMQFAQSADVLYIVHPNHPPAKLSRISVDQFTLEDEEFVNGPYQDENITDITFDPTGISPGPSQIIASDDVFVATDVGRLLRIDETDEPNEDNDNFGYGVITEFQSTTSVIINIIDAFVSGSARKFWRLGAFSDTTGFPSAIAFYEDRLMYAGTALQPQTIWGSQSNIYNDFSPGPKPADAVTYTIASGQENAIRWLSPGKSLTIGTVGGEFLLSASTREEAVTPSNIKIVIQSEYGCAYIMPVRSSGVVLFIQRSTKKLRQFIYQFESDSYIAPDLTLLSEHVTGNGLVELEHQREPDPIIWAVRKDGELLGLTFERDQAVSGWHRHIVGGVSDALGAPAKVESVAVIPGDDRDELWISVKRFINGAEVRHIAVLTEGRGTINPDDADDFFVDSGITFSGFSTTQVGNLEHLEGETVQVLADGATSPDKVVVNGIITLDRPASKVSAGLQYISDLQTMRIDAGSADGSSQGKIKRSHKIDIRLFDSLGLKFGSTEDNLNTVFFRTSAVPMGSPPARFTGDKEQPMPAGYTTDGRVYLRQDQPLPMTVLAIMQRVRTNG
ncbi:MAG: hypothetical protein V3U78_04625 [Thiotrichaceae bacterium]